MFVNIILSFIDNIFSNVFGNIVLLTIFSQKTYNKAPNNKELIYFLLEFNLIL